MASFMDSDVQWKDFASEITVSANGDLVIIPREGAERFIFGYPSQIKDKFRRIREYYECIVPSLEKNEYKSVNVKYEGQIICRK